MNNTWWMLVCILASMSFRALAQCGIDVNRIAAASGVNNTVRALAVLPNGDLIAGGDFTTAGGTTVNSIARWNGAAWSALGAGMNNFVTALAVPTAT